MTANSPRISIGLGRQLGPWLGVAPLFVFAALFLVLPTGLLLVGAFQNSDGHFTLQNIANLARADIIKSFWLSIKISAASAIGGAVIGFALAYAAINGGLPKWIRPTLMTFSGVASNFARVPLALLVGALYFLLPLIATFEFSLCLKRDEYWMSHSQHLMPKSACRCAKKFVMCSANLASPLSSLLMIKKRHFPCQIAVVVMSEGRVEKLGTPLEIYNHPRTRFVAYFVGTLTIMKATIVDPAARTLTIGDQPVTSKLSTHGKADDEVSVALRPEAISLGKARPSANTLNATVTDANFLSSIVRVKMQCGSQNISLYMFNQTTSKPPIVGSTVKINFDQNDLVLLAS